MGSTETVVAVTEEMNRIIIMQMQQEVNPGMWRPQLVLENEKDR